MCSVMLRACLVGELTAIRNFPGPTLTCKTTPGTGSRTAGQWHSGTDRLTVKVRDERRRMMRRAAAALGCIVLSCVAARSAIAAPPDRATLQQKLDRLVAAGVPGAVLLVRDGDRTVRLASGYSIVAGHVRARPGDRFRIGSVTKSFVATVVLQLAAEGKLKLGDTVERLLPGKVRGGAGITLRQLLHQTTGLPDYLADQRVFRPYLKGNLSYAWRRPSCSRWRTSPRRTSVRARSGSTRTQTTWCSG